MSFHGICISKENNKVTIKDNLLKDNIECHLSKNLNEYVSEIYDNKNKKYFKYCKFDFINKLITSKCSIVNSFILFDISQ